MSNDLHIEVNEFLNRVDPIGIMSDAWYEYDIEAIALVDQFKPTMSIAELAELFTACFMHYFNVECFLDESDLAILHNILSQS